MSVFREARNRLRDEFGGHDVTDFHATGRDSDHTGISGTRGLNWIALEERALRCQRDQLIRSTQSGRLRLGGRRSPWAILEEVAGPDFIEDEERELIRYSLLDFGFLT